MQKHKESHMDHGFTQEQWDYIFAKYSDKKEFFIDTFELPENLGTVTDELYGPSAGDGPVPESEVFYAHRGVRAWDSRLVRWPKKPTRFVRVIAGPHKEPCDPAHHWPKQCILCGGTGVRAYACILYTAYGVARLDMPAAPKEPGDIVHSSFAQRISQTEDYVMKAEALRKALREAQAFWSVHALAHEGS
jgi:hypothetical protein